MESFKPLGPSESSKIRLYAEQQLRLLNQNESLNSDKTRYSEWMTGLTNELLGMSLLNKNNHSNRNVPKKGFAIVAGSNTNTSNNQNLNTVNMNKRFDHTTLKVQSVTDDMRRASLSSLEKLQALRENIAIASGSGGDGVQTTNFVTGLSTSAPTTITTSTTTSVFDTANTKENYSYNSNPVTAMSNSSMMHDSNMQAQVQAPPLDSQVKTVHFDVQSSPSSSSSSASEDINDHNVTSTEDTSVTFTDVQVPTIYQEASSGTEADDIASSLPPPPVTASVAEKQEIEVDLSGTFKKGSIVAFSAAVEADLSGLTLDGARKFLAK